MRDIKKLVAKQVEGNNDNVTMTSIQQPELKQESQGRQEINPEKTVVAETKETSEPEVESQVVHNPIFDLNNPDVVFVKRNKLNSRVPTAKLSVYMLKDEREILEKCAEKHHMTPGQYIRTLIINSN